MLTIPMKVVLDLGENRFQLRCMCGRDFTFGPKLNASPEGNARCPKCSSIWDGEINFVDPNTKYFQLAVRFKHAEMNQRYGIVDDVGMLTLAVGIGYDLMHFICVMLPKVLGRYELAAVMIQEIDQAKYEKIAERVAEKNEILDIMQMTAIMKHVFGEGEGE